MISRSEASFVLTPAGGVVVAGEEIVWQARGAEAKVAMWRPIIKAD